MDNQLIKGPINLKGWQKMGAHENTYQFPVKKQNVQHICKLRVLSPLKCDKKSKFTPKLETLDAN